MKVTSFEISKKLKELGVNLPANYYWMIDKENIRTNYGVEGLGLICGRNIASKNAYDNAKNTYKAYTLEDILDVLPHDIADCAARLLIKLIEDGVINIEDGVINVEEVGNE
jgi:hypothetical protein